MKTFEELDQYLGVDFNINLWSDDAMDHATMLLDLLEEKEWERLGQIWKRPVSWQVKLADAVFGSDKPRVIDLLCQMLYSNKIEVALAAAESLDAKEYVWSPDPSLRDVLEKLQVMAKSGSEKTIVNLLQRITSERITVFSICWTFLREFFNNQPYIVAIENARDSIFDKSCYHENWLRITEVIRNRAFQPGEPLILVNEGANQVLEKNSDEEAYIWLYKMVQNVEGISSEIEEY